MADTYYWQFGDGGTATGETATYTYNEAGYFVVSLSARNHATECNDYAFKFVQVGEVECIADFEYSVNSANLKVDFKGKSKGDNLIYYWDFDGLGTSVEKNPKHTFDESGMYTVSLTVSNADGLCFNIIETQTICITYR